jgi:hypothetical protein
VFTRQRQEIKLVGVASTKAQACIELPGRGPLCTPFMGH